jgi:hemerythrin
MDRLHHDFVDRVAEAMAVDKNGMLHALEKVGTHLEEHFSEERLWMESSGFPATECHVEEHEAVLKSYRDVLTHLQEDLGFENAKSFVLELSRWFPGHADYMDASLAQWMSKRTLGGIPVVLRRRKL